MMISIVLLVIYITFLFFYDDFKINIPHVEHWQFKVQNYVIVPFFGFGRCFSFKKAPTGDIFYYFHTSVIKI